MYLPYLGNNIWFSTDFSEALDGVIFQKVAYGFQKSISIHKMVQIFLIMKLNIVKAVPLNAS